MKTVKGYEFDIVDIYSEVGAGSLPTQKLPSKAIKVSSSVYNDTILEEKLRKNHIPIITRISKGNLLMDVRTIFENEFEIIAEALKNISGVNNE